MPPGSVRGRWAGAALFAALGAVTLGVAADVAGARRGPAAASSDSREAQPAEGSAVVWLTNRTVTLGVLPPLGGRVVALRTHGGENLLASDPGHWSPPFPEPSLDLAFQPWNGRIVWVGPQSGFWSQQDLAPDRRASRAGWPPDPFNEAARFDAVERTPTRLVLVGPVSPVTGLRLEHEFEIVGERAVRMKVTATNGRPTPVSWDLWPNTRVPPEGHPYVPVDPAHPPRVAAPAGGPAGPYPYEIRDGWLAMPPGHRPEPPNRRLTAKAFVQPARGLVAYFRGSDLLLIRAELPPAGSVHPEQAAVEIYRGSAQLPADDILELEMHSAWATLPPRGSISFEQTFEILEHEGSADPAGHLARLARLER